MVTFTALSGAGKSAETAASRPENPKRMDKSLLEYILKSDLVAI